MGLCKTCKRRSNNYCKYFSSSLFMIGDDLTVCTGYKKMNPKPKTNKIKKKSIKQEKKLAKDLGAKRTPQSGAKSTSPADMVKGHFVIESKFTKHDSINLKKCWLTQLKSTPMNYGKIPVLIIEFNGRERYAILEEYDLKNLIGG